MAKTVVKEEINPDYPYTVNEAAKMLKVHPETIRNWHNQGKMNFCRLGYRTVRILGQDIIAFVKNNRED